MKWCMWVLDTHSFSFEQTHRNWLRDHTSWVLVELEWRLKVFSRTSDLWFWISLHQGTLSCSYILKLTKHMLSIANEIDPLIFRCVHAYFHQSQIFLLSYNCQIKLNLCPVQSFRFLTEDMVLPSRLKRSSPKVSDHVHYKRNTKA